MINTEKYPPCRFCGGEPMEGKNKRKWFSKKETIKCSDCGYEVCSAEVYSIERREFLPFCSCWVFESARKIWRLRNEKNNPFIKPK